MPRRVASAVILLLFVSACSSAGDAPEVASLDEASGATTTTAEATQADQEQAALEFAQCMRDHGVDMPDPTVDGDGNIRMSPPSFGEDGPPEGFAETARAAAEACGDLLEGVGFGFSPEDQAELQDQLLEFTSCMRDHGIDMPDPNFNGTPGSGGGGFIGRIDPNDPDFQAAFEECRGVFEGNGLVPFGRPPGGGEGQSGGGGQP
ncbi:MAG TPA: hypothetical protein VID03_10055 [Acidimicrobiia bacterium]